MFAPERIKIIKKYLDDNKKAEVSELSSLLDVSEVTIRRDLEKLEKEGFLQRTHGGAIINDDEDESILTPETIDPLAEKRNEIAAVAAHTVHDGDVIMLTQGLTCLHLARNLGNKKKLTVLTNDLLIALELSTFSNLRIIILGGDLENQSRGVYGNFTINSIRSFYVSKLYFEVDGVTRDNGFSAASIEKANLIQEAVKISEESICLCPDDCFDKKAFFPVGELSMAHKIFTNNQISEEMKDHIFRKEIQLFTSMQMYEGHV